jgi:hypothetical protein
MDGMDNYGLLDCILKQYSYNWYHIDKMYNTDFAVESSGYRSPLCRFCGYLAGTISV